MKDFLKFTLASCLGVILAGTLLFFMFFALIAGLASSFAPGGKGKVTVESGSVLKLDFSSAIPEHTNNVANSDFSLMEYDVTGLHDIAALIRHAANDPKIGGILIENGEGALGSGSAEIILNALLDYKESGKPLAAYGDYYTQDGYYLASAAEHIVLHPVGVVDFRGFARVSPFVKGLIDKLGIDIHVYYAGDFKSATEPLRRHEMSPENKLQSREYLTETYALFLEDIAQARGIPADTLKSYAWTFALRDADDALRHKMVDEIGSKSTCDAWLKSRMGKSEDDKIKYVSIGEYAAVTSLPSGDYKIKDKIAVVYAEGEMVSGNNSYAVIDDGRYVKLFNDLRRQKDIKAVVLRINSPGGSIRSAENIYRQLVALKEDGKSLVVSMGDYAASGGYYISAPADSIFAQAGTLTGSIGVFSVLPNPSRGLDEKLGIRFDTVRTGPYSADFTLMLPTTEREHQYLQARTNAYYELFLHKVAEGRSMTRDQVHAIAQGRIWSGQKAVELGLVDRIGTLEDAIAAAANLAGLEEYRIREYPVFQNPLQKMITDLVEPGKSDISAMVGIELPQMMYTLQNYMSGEPLARLPIGF